MGAICRSNTQERFYQWAKKKGLIKKWKAEKTPVIIVSGGIAEHAMGGKCLIIDIDNLTETDETEEDYENAINEQG